jgi:hypothetical protein
MDSYGEAQEACAAALARLVARPHTTAPLRLASRCRDVLLDQAQQRLELVLGVPPHPSSNHQPTTVGGASTEDILRVLARRADPEPRRLLDLLAGRTRVADEVSLTDLMRVTAGESPLWVGAARAAVLATDHLQQDHRFWPRPAAGWLVVADVADLAAAVCLLDETLAAHPDTDPGLRGRLLDPGREHLDAVAALTGRIAGSEHLDGRLDLTRRPAPVRPVVVHDMASALAGATVLAGMLLQARPGLPVTELRTVLTGQSRVYTELARLAAVAEPRGGRAHRLHRHAGVLRDTAAATVKLASLEAPQAPGPVVWQVGELARVPGGGPGRRGWAAAGDGAAGGRAPGAARGARGGGRDPGGPGRGHVPGAGHRWAGSGVAAAASRGGDPDPGDGSWFARRPGAEGNRPAARHRPGGPGTGAPGGGAAGEAGPLRPAGGPTHPARPQTLTSPAGLPPPPLLRWLPGLLG